RHHQLCQLVLRVLAEALVAFSAVPPPPTATLFPYTTLFRSRTSRNTPRSAPRAASSRRRLLPGGDDHLPRREPGRALPCPAAPRSEEHTSELQSRENLVCRLLLEKKN